MGRLIGRRGAVYPLIVIAIGLGTTGLGLASIRADGESGPSPTLPHGEFSMMLKVDSAEVDPAEISSADIEHCADGRPVPMPNNWERISDIPIETTDGSNKTFANENELLKLQSQGLFVGIEYRPVPEDLCGRFAIDLAEMARRL